MVQVVNNAGKPVQLYWVDSSNPGNLVSQTAKPLRNNSIASINSYDGHSFLVKFRDEIPGTEAQFVKGASEETITVVFDEPSGRLVAHARSKEDELMEKVDGMIKTCEDNQEEIKSCLADAVAAEIGRMQAAHTMMTEYRDIMAGQLRNYTCADEKLETTTPEKTLPYRLGRQQYPLNVFMDHDDAKIWTLDHFVTDEECAHLMEYAGPLLSRATVAGDDGLDSFSESRKAQQAGYEFLGKDLRTDPIWPLYQRIIAVMNDRGGYDIRPEGQEGFTIIQYGVGDEYTNHCDGACDGSFYKPGGRVGTAVVYCQAADRGGKTTFSRADVVLSPRKGMAAFFAYKGRDGRMDEGYTDHSGCPVLEGEKWIATAWLREGVSAERPWTLFDPEGIEVLDEAEHMEQGEVPAEEQTVQVGADGNSEL